MQNAGTVILQQLGGTGRLSMMLGAKDFLVGDDLAQFRIGRGAKQKINRIVISLASDDTYSVTFYAGTALNLRRVSEQHGVYVESLRPVLESTLGMYLSL